MKQDAMEWGKYIYALLRTLERAETPFVLGVYGGWGSGKTSFVNCLGDAAKNGGYSDNPRYDWRVVKVNPWECDTPEDAKRLIATSLWREFFNEASWSTLDEGRLKLRAFGRRNSKAAIGVLKGIASTVSAGGVGDAVEAMFSSDASVAQVFRENFREDLNLALRKKKESDRPSRVLVIIDDLDRCRPEIIPEVLETVKLYLDQEGCLFVLAADPTRIGQVLGEAYAPKDAEGKPEDAEHVGQRYLDKIVQLPFWVPRMDDDAAERFFDQCACSLDPEVSVSDKMLILLLNHVLERNPRSIKRFCLTHGLLAEVGDDLDGDKLAKVLAIDWYFPGMRKGYVRPGHGASLLMKDQSDARGETKEDDDPIEARARLMSREDAVRHAARLLDPRLKMILAAEPPFRDKADVDKYFDLTSAGPSRVDAEDEFQAALKMLDADSAQERLQGTRLLGEIGDARAVEPLIARMRDEKPICQHAAALALGEIGEAARQPLMEHLGDEQLGVSVSIGLAKMGAIVVEPLIARLGDEHATGRGQAAQALGMIRDERAVEPLIERLRDEDPFLVLSAALALGMIGDERAVGPLIERLDDAFYVRGQAAMALGSIGAAAGAALPRLRELEGEDEDEFVRERAREAVKSIEAAIAEQEAGEQSESDAEDE